MESLYKTDSVNEIARKLIGRVRDFERSWPGPVAGTPSVSLASSSVELIIFFDEKYLAPIITEGFKNLHQTGHTQAGGHAELRLPLEDFLVGASLGEHELALRLRPKSGFVNILDDVDLVPRGWHMFDFYGGIAAVLKPDLKERALWVAGDSLTTLHEYVQYPVIDRDVRRVSGTFSRSLTERDERGDSAYFEALVFGDIRLEDVDHFLVSDESLVAQLRPLGKKIYLGKEVHRNHRYVYERVSARK